MTLPRTLVVTLLNLLPAPVRRRLIVAILRRFLRPARRPSSRRTLRRVAIQFTQSTRAHARGVVGDLARAGHHTAQAARALVAAAVAVAAATLAALDHAAGRLAADLPPRLHRLRLSLARLRVPSRAPERPAAEGAGAGASGIRQPALHGLGLARREHARPSAQVRRPRLALAALEDWLRCNSDPPSRASLHAGVRLAHA